MLKEGTLLAVALALLTVITGCTKSLESHDPKARLSAYISKSFSVKGIEDKAILMGYLTSEVRNRLEGWSEDQFREAFIDSKRQFLHLLFREVKVISPTEIQVTYELSFTEQAKTKDGKTHDAKVTNKKLCQMVLEKGNWMIADVRNIKELVEYKNELSLP